MSEKEFISGWTARLSYEGIKSFPNDFIMFNDHKEVRLPGKTLILGEEFFGNYEILTVDGISVLHAESGDQAKFILYANRNKPEIMHIPLKESELKSSISGYEEYLDSIIRKIESDYKENFPDEKNFNAVMNDVFRVMNLIRLGPSKSQQESY
jgi:hypothetical protein